MFEDLVQLSASLPPQHTRKIIPDGVQGTAETIAAMQRLVAQGKRDYANVGTLARQLIADCPHKDFVCQARRIFDYVQNTIAYVYDPVGVEMLVAPSQVIQAKGGDCDDKVVLLAAMLEGIGIRCDFVTLKADSSQPDEFSHVYVRAHIPGGQVVAMDATMQKPMGWEPPEHFGIRVWPASLDKSEDQEASMGRLGGVGRHHHGHHGGGGWGGGWYGPGFIDYGYSPLVVVDATPSGQLTAEEKAAVCAKRPKDDPFCSLTAGSVLGLGTMPQPKAWLNKGVDIPRAGRQRVAGKPGVRPVGQQKWRRVTRPQVSGLEDTGTLCQRPSLSGLGDDLDYACDAAGVGAACTAIRSVLDGTYAQAIRDANIELNAQTVALGQASQAVRNADSDTQQRVLAEVAVGRQQVADARQQVIDATGKYNWIAGEFRNAGVSVPSPNLQGLGAAFVIPAVGTLVAIAAVAVALALAIDSLSSSIHGGKGTLENINGILGSSGTTTASGVGGDAGTQTYTDTGIVGIISQVGKQTTSIMWIAAALGVGYVAYLWLKKSGRI